LNIKKIKFMSSKKTKTYNDVDFLFDESNFTIDLLGSHNIIKITENLQFDFGQENYIKPDLQNEELVSFDENSFTIEKNVSFDENNFTIEFHFIKHN
jgi:hypothetical protein